MRRTYRVVLVFACALVAALALRGVAQLLDDDLPLSTTTTTSVDVRQPELPPPDVVRSTSVPYPVPPEPPEPPPEPPPTTEPPPPVTFYSDRSATT